MAATIRKQMPYFALLLLLLFGNVPAFGIIWLCRKRFLLVKKMAYSWILLFSILQLSFFVDEMSGWKKKRLFQAIKQDFSAHFQILDGEKQLFALSLLAEKMKKEAIFPEKKAEIQAFFTQEIMPNVPFEIAKDTNLWKNNALYLSQLAIIFTAYHDIFPTDTSYQKLHGNMIHFLYKEMKNSPTKQLCSYPDFAEPWLCDNAGIVYALALYDAEYKTHFSLWEEWQTKVNQDFTDPKTGLPCTQISEKTGCFVPTRASSTAWLMAYLAEISPKEGKKAWNLYKKQFKFSFAGIGAAFFEYSDDTKTEDYDTGTLIFGLGTIGSGLSIRAASENEDWLTYFQLVNTLNVVSLGAYFFPEMENDVLIKAILYRSCF